MIDRVEIKVKAGDGGDGAISFRREKFVPFGGPDGGDGGNGGDVIVKADKAVTSLRQIAQKRYYRAGNGANGAGQKKHGKRGEDVILTVPVGTVVSYKMAMPGEGLIADLARPGQQVVVAKGGRGGLGNTHFASSTNQAPRIAQRGEAGEEATLILEMRLIADVGIIGYPNVGKSTLLAAASAAKPKIAGYPFTTREPVLGVVEVGRESFVLAEIPGLIEDAHLGRGLGHDFLRHAMRTKVFIHLISGMSPAPVEDMRRVNAELSLFDSALGRKPQIVAVNKIDLAEVRCKLDEIGEAFRQAGLSVHFISAATGEGVAELMAEAARVLAQVQAEANGMEIVPRKVFRPQPKARRASVRREGDIFIVEAPELERIITTERLSNYEIRGQLKQRLARLGVIKTLEKAGIKPGDKVRCGNLEWEW
ncbi:MAG TPA: GTPase ObgE [Dehalococcoidia bacterium]|nr:GTPase ObgE [Dehalococcoidia bacterium]